MHIIVCVMQDYDITGPFSFRREASAIDFNGVVSVMNPADVSALSLVRDSLDADAWITSVTVGPESVEPVLRKSLELGASRAVRIWDKRLESYCDAESVSRALAAYVAKVGADLVVCGASGLTGGSGYVPAALAEFLGLPHVSCALGVENAPRDSMLRIERRLARGKRELIEAASPLVISVESGVSEPDYPSLPDVIRAQQAEIELHDFGSLDYAAPFYPFEERELVGFVPPRPRPKKVKRSKEKLTKAQMMQQMLGGSDRKQGALVEGTPAELADAVIEFLEANGVAAWGTE